MKQKALMKSITISTILPPLLCIKQVYAAKEAAALLQEDVQPVRHSASPVHQPREYREEALSYANIVAKTLLSTYRISRKAKINSIVHLHSM